MNNDIFESLLVAVLDLPDPFLFSSFSFPSRWWAFAQ